MQIYYSFQGANEALGEFEGATAMTSEYDTDGMDKY